MAKSRNILLRLMADGSNARDEVRETANELRRLGREEVKARIGIERRAIIADIERVRGALKKLEKDEIRPDVKLRNEARLTRQLTSLEGRLTRLDQREVNIDIDVRRGGFETAARGVRNLTNLTTGLGQSFGTLLRSVPLLGTTLGFAFRGILGIATQIGSVLTSLITTALSQLPGMLGRMAGPIGAVVGGLASTVLQVASMGAAVGGAIIALNAFLGAIVALGAALVALVASLTAAVGGLAAIGIAFAGILAPAVLVLIGLFTRFSAIMEARKAKEQALTQAVQEQKTAEQQRVAALQTLRSAQERLTETTVEGRRAMAAAAEDQEDAERSLESARLGIQEAKLNLRDARAELREFLRGAGAAGAQMNALMNKFTNVDFDPSRAGNVFSQITGERAGGDKSRELTRRIIAIQRAHLGVKDAVDRVGDSETALAEARQKHTEFTERGIRAYRPYRQAVAAVATAQRRLERATTRTSAAQEDYQRKLEALSTTERGSLDRLNRFIDGFKSLAKSFTDPIFRAINDVFDDLSGNTGHLERGLRTVGRAFGEVVRSFGRFLGERSSRQAFSEMARGAASLARNLGARAFVDFLRIMRNIARVALPALVSGAGSVATKMREWAVGSGTRSFAITIRNLVGHFKNWLGLARDVGALVLAIFRGAAGAGGDVVTHIRRWVREQTKLIQQDPEKVRRFFRKMVERAREVVAWIGVAIDWLKNKLPVAAEQAKTIFGDILTVVRDIAKAWNSMKGLADALTPPVEKNRKGSPTKWLLDRVLGERHTGGTVDSGLYNLQRGEEVIRASVASQFRGQLKALNAGLPPQMAFAGGSSSRSVSVTAPISVVGGGPPDPDVLAQLLTMRLRRLGA